MLMGGYRRNKLLICLLLAVLMVACYSNNIGSDSSCFACLETNNYEYLTKTIDKVNIDSVVSPFNETCLLRAVKLDKFEIVKILSDNNANEEIKDIFGYTPKDYVKNDSDCRIKKLFGFSCSSESNRYLNIKYSTDKLNDSLYIYKIFVSGELAQEIEVINSARHGTTKWYENGKIAAEANYQYGILNGIYKSYHNNGTLYLHIPYAEGLINGIVYTYDEDGRLIEEDSYINNRLFGKSKEYINGNLSVSFTYKNDTLHGETVFYLPNGTPYEKVIFEHGKEKEIITY